MKEAREGRSMATQFQVAVLGREFGDSLLSIAEFKAWLTKTGEEVETAPPLPDSGFIQVEMLLCGIELAAQNDYPDEAARAIVAAAPPFSTHELADAAPNWLIGAETHRAWRERLREAIEQGELKLRDPIAKRPIAAPQRPANKAAALTAEQREQIVKRANSGEKHTALANEFNVTRQYVSKLCKQVKENAQPTNWAFGKKN